MKEALLYAVGDVRVVDSPKPTINEEEILVAVRSCGVCPTDARKYRTGNHGVPHWPFNMGHEFSGDVVEAGRNVKKWKVGQRVAVTTYNGYAEYVKIGPEEFEAGVSSLDSLLEMADSVTYEEATFVEPLADVIHSLVDQAQVQIGDKMVVLGGGQLGLQHLMLAKAMGIRVLLSDLIDERLKSAQGFGAEVVINPSKTDAVEAVQEWTGGVGADAVIVAAGATQAVEQAMRMVRKGGRVVLFAGFEYNKVIQIDPNVLHYGEIILTGSYWVGLRPHPRLELYQRALDLIASRQVPVAELITHRFALGDIKQALETVMRQEGLKVMINFP
jgi:L-iditol 2-dehydrogenase